MRRIAHQKTTAWRGYGDETPIGRSIRNNPNLPSRSNGSAFVVSNTDLTIHAYMISADGIGQREVQSIIRVEFKSHGKMPDKWQLDTLFKEHAGINRCPRGYRCKRSTIINHGIFLCVCSGSVPEDSDVIKWGWFGPDGEPIWRVITLSQLNAILRFDLHPKRLTRMWLRRHHKEETFTINVQGGKCGMLFDDERELIRRS